MTTAKAALHKAMPQFEAALTALRDRTYSEIAALPEVTAVPIDGCGKDVMLTTYRDSGASGAVQVVVQLMARGWLGSARIKASGFSYEANGKCRDLQEEELYDFT